VPNNTMELPYDNKDLTVKVSAKETNIC